MVQVLKSVKWGKPALRLLLRSKQIDTALPKVMHIRHTERVIQPGNIKEFEKLSTEQGKKAAYEFGTNLPKKYCYRLYYTHLGRTRETVERIHEGIQDNESSSEIIGPITLSTIVDREKSQKLVVRELKDESNEPWEIRIFNKWISNHFPPWVRVPALNFAQRGASIMMNNLKSASESTFDIYVSHDVFIAAFLLFWFGIFPSDWINFLDGFILQFADTKMTVYSKYGEKKTGPPFWWSF